jgi:hypothetical protein
MDIEGGEVLALPGMQRLLDEVRPIMLVELHGEEAAAVVWKVLTGAGYRICKMTARYPQIKSLAELDWKAYVIAFPAEQYFSEMVHRA